MKSEITLAIVMLAGGIVAAITLSVSGNGVDGLPSTGQQGRGVQPQPILVRKAPAQENLRIARSPDRAASDAQPNHNELIRTAARALNHSPPLKARLRYKIHLFGERISGPGHYYQKGQGTRLTRLQFEFGFNQSTVQIHQFCDGDKLYTLSMAGDKTKLEFVDLRQLDSLQNEMPTPSRVDSWLSVGSLTGLMEQLSTHFLFTEVEEGTLDSIPVLICTGEWNPSALERLLEGQLSAQAARDGAVRWQQLPKHLPHRVKLTLGADQRFPYFPYRVVFEQYTLSDGQAVANEVAVLELFEVKQALNLSDEMFSIPSVETKPVDSTEFYRKRIMQFTR